MRRMYSKKQLEKIISELSGDLIEVKNIKQLSDEECNNLKVGDIVAKKTGEQYHCYIVTFKQDKGGLCLSYFDASVIETQSYDYTEGHWVYNSEDKTDLSQIGGLEVVEISGSISESETTIEITQAQYQKLLSDNVVLKVNDAENGSLYMYKTNDTTEPNMAIYSNILTNVSFNAVVQQVETEGEPEYAVIITSQAIGGGTKLYKHDVTITGSRTDTYVIISTRSEKFSSFTQLSNNTNILCIAYGTSSSIMRNYKILGFCDYSGGSSTNIAMYINPFADPNTPDYTVKALSYGTGTITITDNVTEL